MWQEEGTTTIPLPPSFSWLIDSGCALPPPPPICPTSPPPLPFDTNGQSATKLTHSSGRHSLDLPSPLLRALYIRFLFLDVLPLGAITSAATLSLRPSLRGKKTLFIRLIPGVSPDSACLFIWREIRFVNISRLNVAERRKRKRRRRKGRPFSSVPDGLLPPYPMVGRSAAAVAPCQSKEPPAACVKGSDGRWEEKKNLLPIRLIREGGRRGRKSCLINFSSFSPRSCFFFSSSLSALSKPSLFPPLSPHPTAIKSGVELPTFPPFFQCGGGKRKKGRENREGGGRREEKPFQCLPTVLPLPPPPLPLAVGRLLLQLYMAEWRRRGEKREKGFSTPAAKSVCLLSPPSPPPPPPLLRETHWCSTQP